MQETYTNHTSYTRGEKLMEKRIETHTERAERLRAEAEALRRKGKPGQAWMKFALAQAARRLAWTDD